MKKETTILNAKKCGDIFTNNAAKAKAEYRELSRKYHPDIYSGDSRVMAKINELYERAVHLLATGDWEVSNQIILTKPNGDTVSCKYLSEKAFELGAFYICDTEVIYIIDAKHEKFYRNATAKVKSLKYANDRMKTEMERFMPQVKYGYRLKDGRWCIAFPKPEDAFLLEDLLDHFKGAIPAKHAAWIISRLSNICCYLDYSKLAHNGISTTSCFVSPKHHTVILLGGWWYCTKQGEKMIGTQKAIYDAMPVKNKGNKAATIVTDLECVKQIGRKIIDKTAPNAMIKFLRSGSSEKAAQEFSKWGEALTESFGERKFIKLNIAKSDIYKN